MWLKTQSPITLIVNKSAKLKMIINTVSTKKKDLESLNFQGLASKKSPNV